MSVWYVAYGSNLDRDRFERYLSGGRAPGTRRGVPGARDRRPPAQERAVIVPGGLCFGWTSPTWGGGVAFLDAHAYTTAYGRAYLLTEQQFADVAAQEMHQVPGADLDLSQVLEHRRHTFGSGRYETLHLLGELEGLPMLTFTVDDPDALERNQPTEAYLRAVVRGLRETHGLGAEQVAEHLAGRPGIGGWTLEEIAELVG